MEVDILIVGTGVSALYLALNLSEKLNILMVSKTSVDETNSFLAQGGISVARNKADIPTFIEDTLKAGKYLNNKNSVEILAKESMDNIKNLIKLGVPFDTKNDKLCFTKEGAHSINRIVHVKDETGKGVSTVLLNEVLKRKNITLLENTTLIDLITNGNSCNGGRFIIKNANLNILNKIYSKKSLKPSLTTIIKDDTFTLNVFSKVTVLATGGIGGLFKDSTNMRSLTGDSIYLSLKHNIMLKDLDYIQIHPTALYTTHGSRRFLISEALRGEGAILLNSKGNRFVNELLPRDIVSKAILNEINSSINPYVYLDISFKDSDYLKNRFPAIYLKCLEEGLDLTKEPIKVSPAQHYFMGGIAVDLNSKTSMKNIYAIGETSCTGVHGANRLASNSLLEALVFSKRAALDINKNINSIPLIISKTKPINNDLIQIEEKMHQITINEFKRRLTDINVKLVNY
ncbi:L-aspartate oxidase [Clostridium cavendishii DSM 21758]|uniref:L-aspartate oxidase n=1 Tax=Clostridium cavendishii DSM 21758 TaxID=1121302 RepID=A0A1M6ARF3_9CLOT|nr:L-aspartate oxidase [Clostridium cavendishii DSM 21758]